MHITNQKKPLKIVLIGAGSTAFTRGLVADLVARRWAADLALVDIDPEALEIARRVAEKMVAAAKVPVRVTASTDRRTLLKDAAAVICTVGVGGRRAWEQDVFIPRKYGVYQPVGDSVMPGGTSRSLRMIPALVDIARDVLDLCPQALFFNYSNPMAPNCRGILKATGAKVVGLCHGVNHVAHFLAKCLGITPAELTYTAVGMNHLTWFTECRVKGQDVMPRLRELAREKLAGLPGVETFTARGEKSTPPGHGPESKTANIPEINPFSWQLLRLFGAFPAVLDRHVVEFFPQFFAEGSYYGLKLGVDAFSFEQTIGWGDTGYAEMREVAYGTGPLPEKYLASSGGEHEQVIDIIDSIRTDARRMYSVNLPNRGQVPNLPAEAVIESPALADATGLHPITLPPLPAALAGTLATRLAWVETTVEAALEGSREKFIQALVLDGAVGSLETAACMADELLAAQAQYLPQFAS